MPDDLGHRRLGGGSGSVLGGGILGEELMPHLVSHFPLKFGVARISDALGEPDDGRRVEIQPVRQLGGCEERSSM
jgi:hypothetical protein